MIIRRIADAIREQNWFTVFIEFTLVVAGVLVALQFDNWNKDRLDSAAEKELAARLYADVQATQVRLENFADIRQTRLENLRSAGYFLFGGNITRSLSDEECKAIQVSHIITFPPANVATLEEVLAGGQIALIKSTALRQAILDFERADDRARTLYSALNIDRIELGRLYPELIALSYIPNTDNPDGYDLIPVCDDEAMLENRAFLNDLASLSGRNEAFVRLLIGELAEALQRLRNALEATTPTQNSDGVRP